MEFKDTKRKKNVPRRSILSLLYDREINGMKTVGNCVRATYDNVFPNCTVINVERPPCYIRKFTPDGRNLIAFSRDLTSLEVFEYLGCSKAADLLKNYQGNVIGHYSDGNVRQVIFDRLFQLKYRIKMTSQGERLNRVCCLFTENGYAIVVSASHVTDDLNPHFFDVYTNNESMSYNPQFPLKNYTIYLVNINCGTISDSVQFKCDKIYLSHSLGLYLLKNTLAILSVQHQEIHIYKIIENRLSLIRSVGRFCFEDDHLLIASVHTNMNGPQYLPFRENSINGLKHKLMIYLHQKAEDKAKNNGTHLPLEQFYRYFDHYLSLRMWKMQLLGENHLLIRYSTEDVVALKKYDPNKEIGIFLIYDMDTAKILDVFGNTSSELLEIFERYSNNFPFPYANIEGFMPSSSVNNVHAWESYQKFKNTYIKAKYSDAEATRRILSYLPIAAQSFMSTPYLDKSLYSYDEVWVSALDRPMSVGELPIRFFSRNSGKLNFSLYTKESRMPTKESLHIIVFAFHPTDPFAISLQMENFEYFVNFHIRKVYMPE